MEDELRPPGQNKSSNNYSDNVFKAVKEKVTNLYQSLAGSVLGPFA